MIERGGWSRRRMQPRSGSAPRRLTLICRRRRRRDRRSSVLIALFDRDRPRLREECIPIDRVAVVAGDHVIENPAGVGIGWERTAGALGSDTVRAVSLIELA